jgi:hypothetical protein
LQVSVPYFYGSAQNADDGGSAPQPQYVLDFLACVGGLELVRAFTQISDAKCSVRTKQKTPAFNVRIARRRNV